MKYSHILNTTFLLAICTPLCAMMLGIGNTHTPTAEHATPPRWPDLEWDMGSVLNYPVRVGNHLAGNFGLRFELIQLRTTWNVKILRQSPSPAVVLGQEDWLFYSATLEHRRQDLLTEEELTDWISTLEQFSQWLNARGSTFQLVIIPGKATVYPEYLPPHVHLPRESLRTQIVNALQSRTTVNVLDLTSTLINHKPHGQLYDRTDTHWNQAGAFVAAAEIAGALREQFADVPSVEESDYAFYEIENYVGDLAAMTPVEGLFPDTSIGSVRKTEPGWTTQSFYDDGFHTNGLRSIRVTESQEGSSRRAVIFHDSFTENLVEFQSPLFAHTRYMWKYDVLDTQRLETIHPDVVILQIAERHLPRVLKMNAPIEAVPPRISSD